MSESNAESKFTEEEMKEKLADEIKDLEVRKATKSLSCKLTDEERLEYQNPSRTRT